MMILMCMALIISCIDIALSKASNDFARLILDIGLAILILIEIINKFDDWTTHHNEQYVKKNWWKNE